MSECQQHSYIKHHPSSSPVTYLVFSADFALPVVVGHLFQRRVDTLEVVGGRARLAAEQVSQLVT